MANDINKLGEAVKKLFKQISTEVGGIENIQVVINVEPQERSGPEGEPRVTGVLTRQVLEDGQVALRWLPDHPAEPVTQEVRAQSEEKQFWQDLFALDETHPEFELDDGIAVLRINAPDVGDVAVWIPYDANATPIHNVLPEEDPGGDSYAKFLGCLRAHSTSSNKLTRCWRELFP